MNDLLRLLRRSLRPFGYDIRKYGSYNLLPLKGAARTSELDRVRENFSDHRGEADFCNLENLKIIFRTCLTEERARKSSRVAEAGLFDTVERCFSSLIASVNAALREEEPPRIELMILDDHSDGVYRDRIRALARRLECPSTFRETDGKGQGASLHQQFVLARDDDALFYFCEDDYLHERSAVYEMWAFYRQLFSATGRHLVLHPQEDERLYTGYHPSYLILSPVRHWRSVSDATHILFTHTHVVRDYWRYFENVKFMGGRKRRLGSERRTTNRLYAHLPCFVPIPALAGHMQSVDVLPPFFNWRPLWDANRPFKAADDIALGARITNDGTSLTKR